MKTRFSPQVCPSCRQIYDGLAHRCPACGAESGDPGTKSFRNFVLTSALKQAGLFLAGWAGFQLIATLVSVLFQLVWTQMNPGFTAEMMEGYLASYEFGGPVNFVSYSLLFAVLTAILWKDNLAVFSSFKHGKAYLWGIGSFAALFLVQLVYGNIVAMILQANGMEMEQNLNENTLTAIAKAYPVAAMFIFGLVAPYCEEITYRVGLYSFFGRFGKWAAYLFSAIVFGLIHFDWNCFGSPEAMVVELYNIPVYLFAGGILGFAYDKGGFASSFVAHAANNLFSTLMNVIGE